MGRILRIESESNTRTQGRDLTAVKRRTRLALGGLLLPAVLAMPLGAASSSPFGSTPRLTQPSRSMQDGNARTPERYVLAGATGARLMNLPDSKGREVLKVDGSTPLAVFAAREGSPYLKVTAPGGVKIWVYGKYLTESSRPGWVEVAGSYVNMRPLPQSQDSYPLGQLDRGDRLRFIQRQNPSKPMSEDWVQVYSPPETMAYVLAAETRAMPANAKPTALWAAAVTEALNGQPTAPVSTGGTASNAGPVVAVEEAAAGTKMANPGNVFTALAAADRAMDTALAGEGKPDYDQLLGNYQDVLALGPDAPTRHLVDQRVERLEAHRELAAIRAEIEATNKAREEQLAGLRGAADAGQRGHDPLWGRFQTRGWLERQTQNGKVRYLVRWGADFLAEVQCSSGRYELALYDGFEIGIKGVPVRSAQVTQGSYPLVDIDRIEVISARRTRR